MDKAAAAKSSTGNHEVLTT